MCVKMGMDYLQEKHGYFALEKRGDFWYAIKDFNKIRMEIGRKIKQIIWQ